MQKSTGHLLNHAADASSPSRLSLITVPAGARFPGPVMTRLMRAGWREDRSIDISSWVHELSTEKLTMSKVADAALRSFGVNERAAPRLESMVEGGAQGRCSAARDARSVRVMRSARLHQAGPFRTRLACYHEPMERTCFDILAELFSRDVDTELLKRASSRTPTERIIWLEEMQAFADHLEQARVDETPKATISPE